MLLVVACTETPEGSDLTLATTTMPPPETSAGDTSSTSGEGTTSEASGGGTTADSTADETGNTPKLDVASPETGEPPMEIAEVFGHSGNVLYRLDPDTNEVNEVGPFVGCDPGSVIDIALDADSRMFGTGYSRLWSIDRMTAQCTEIAQGSYPTSLSFVPAGTVDLAVEALVGFDDADYIRIDTTTGQITTLGTLPGGLVSSGDMVSVIGGSSYLTVRGPGCDTTDCIVEIDPVDGSVIQNFGPLPYDQVFGLAFWAGRAYGFAREGVLFEIDFMGGNVVTNPIPIPGAPANLEWFGAGSTTSAPPVAG
ncbi:MAG: hypothetical protein H6712_10750 [Myxococcales bacterium]|nr:hypothetical protein [Myxococcales bacterium]MCB9714328.1 hypothetical protein [Myxococcales bacterium]